ncbi:hypothetical protein HPB52_004852 [Rhipicephalus sanguineus]|uniref:Uncharacterized protein n=1 Tax=Rhipicephalus sanguineus TaxID=34632 RepID=A0A9D4PWW7_RHISA|nr:hypothetical protein HPB52_004852 [Rhipicephalus sanguineus]
MASAVAVSHEANVPDSIVGMFVWNCVLPTLPRNKKTVAKPQKVELIENVTVEEWVRRTLELGPKFCFQPQLKAAQALAMGRAVADGVPETEKPRCIAECAGRLDLWWRTKKGFSRFYRRRFSLKKPSKLYRNTSNHLLENRLKLRRRWSLFRRR